MNDRLQAVPEDLVEQAAEWLVRQEGDDPAEARAAADAFAAWKAADPRHAAAAARLENVIDGLREIRQSSTQSSARKALRLSQRPRWSAGARALSILLIVAAGLFPAVWISGTQPTHLMADLRTLRGEWTARTLDDGSRLALSGGTAVNLEFTPEKRIVRLLDGEIMVDVAPDANRPFVVETEYGTIRALGTRFLVTAIDGATRLSMLESRVEVRTAPDAPPRLLRAGESLTFGPNHEESPEAVDSSLLDTAWNARQMVVRDRPLGEVLDEIARHRSGYLRYDRKALAGIHVSAVLPLDDTDRALQLLLNSFPELHIRRITPYLVMVGRAEKP